MSQVILAGSSVLAVVLGFGLGACGLGVLGLGGLGLGQDRLMISITSAEIMDTAITLRLLVSAVLSWSHGRKMSKKNIHLVMNYLPGSPSLSL